MAINDEIAAGVKPVQFENPLNNMVKFANIQNDMANMALHRQKTAESQRLQADDVNFKNAMASIADPYSPEGKKQVRQAYYNNRMGDKFEAMQTSEAAVNKSNTDVAAKKLEMRGQAYRNIVGNPSPENIIAHNQDFQLDPDNSSQEKAQSQRTADMLVALPLDQRVAWLASQGASAADLKQHIGTVNTGGSTVTTSTNPFSGKTTQVGEVAHTLTPEQELNAVPGQAKLVTEYNQTAAAIQGLLAKANDPDNAGQATQILADAKDLSNSNELRGEAIKGMQGQAAQGKHAASGDMQLVNELSMLEANGQGKSPRATHVRALLAKQEHIAEPEQYTEDGLRLAAQMVAEGIVPPRGGKGAINAAAAAGVTGKDFKEGKASLGALGALNKQQALTGAFEKTFNANADATLKAGLALNGRSGVPIIDEYIANPFAKATGKNPELAGFKVYLKGTLNEYAKIVSGTTGNAAVAQAEIKRMTDLLNAAQTREQLISTINAMKAEVANRRKGFIEQKAEMRGEPVAPAEAEVAAPHKHPKTKGRDTTNPLL